MEKAMLTVLYKDENIAVIIKPARLISEDGAEGESVMPLIRKELGCTEVYPVHRLDRGVSGVMVYALNKKSAAALSLAVQNGDMKKTYLAIVNGIPAEKKGEMCDFLFKDARKNKSYVVSRERKGVKKASLEYEVLKTLDERTLVRILLHTGRSHQIRVQFSSRKMPLVGDGKYGAADNVKSLCLFSHALVFPNPHSGENMSFSALPRENIWQEFL